MPYVDSQAIRRVEWSGGTLSVWFADGDRYDYPGVPARVYAAMLAAPSVGRFFTAEVRDRYPALPVPGG